MIARAGTSVTLSLVIVVVATVVLHRPERGKAVPPAPTIQRAPQARPMIEPEKPPEPRPPDVPKPPAPVPPNRPRAAFERVRDGESFADVAKRVYGPGADLQAFWKVNRDQMASPEAEVHPGMVLRTPAL